MYLAGPPYAEEYRRLAEALVRALGGEPVDPMYESPRRISPPVGSSVGYS